MVVSNLNIDMSVLSMRGGVTISWKCNELPKDFVRFDVIRKKASIPAHYFDGKLMYSGTGYQFKDEDIRSGSIYYYRLFMVVGEAVNYNAEFITDSRCVVKSMAFALDMKSYGEKLYHTLPDQVLADDLAQNADLPLLRFFKLLMTEFDKLDVIQNAILDQLDVETCDEAFLPYHAKWIGLDYDRNFDVETNRLLLETWKEIEPYQGTEPGLRYLLQKAFKSEVKVTVDTFVNIVVITIWVDEARYWMINHIDKINKLIRKFLALRTKYDLTIRLGPIEETFDWERFEEWYFDFIYCNPENEFYATQDPCWSEEKFLLSDSLFFSTQVPNRIVDWLLDVLHFFDEDLYYLEQSCELNNEVNLLSSTLFWSHRIMDSDEHLDKVVSDDTDQWFIKTKREQAFDRLELEVDDQYAREKVLSCPSYLLSQSLMFGRGADKDIVPKDYLFDVVKTDDGCDTYTLESHTPLMTMDGCYLSDSLFFSTLSFSPIDGEVDEANTMLFSDKTRLFNGMRFFPVYRVETDVHEDKVIDASDDDYELVRDDPMQESLSCIDYDKYDNTSPFSGFGCLLSQNLMFGRGRDFEYKPKDELVDKGIVDDGDNVYSLGCFDLLSVYGCNLCEMCFSTPSKKSDVLDDSLSDVSDDAYSLKCDGDSDTHESLSSVDYEQYDSTIVFAAPMFLLSSTLMFGRSRDEEFKPKDEGTDIVTTEDCDDNYPLDPFGLLSSDASHFGKFLFATECRELDDSFDTVQMTDVEVYRMPVVDEQSDIISNCDDEKAFRTGCFNDPEYTLSGVLMFNMIRLFTDEFIDKVVYTRPVGLFSSRDAFMCKDMMFCDNLI